MPASFTKPLIAAVLITLVSAAAAAAQATPYNRLCDPAYENCRAPLLELIDKETVGIDVGFWFMEDTRYASALIRKFQAGVPVRVIFDNRAITTYGYADAALPIQMMKDARIPMRHKTGSSGIFHFKMMLFAGQNVVEFSGANFSDEAFVSRTPYANYVDEIIMFSDEPGIVNSFKTRFDDVWTDVTTGSQRFANYANITGALVRHYPVFPMDPELQFSPWNSFASRIIARYKAETQGIDAIMYRITDKRHTDQMIAAVARGVPVRLISEPEQYRSLEKYWHSWNIDRMYMAGIQIRHRKHLGQSHEKLVLLRSQNMTVLGSSNWTSASDSSQHEHNRFTTDQWIYDWSRDHFDRKWNNLGPVEETEPFVPLPPDAPVVKAPADGAQNQPLAVTLKWNAGPWAHKYDVYLGTSPTTLTRILDDVELGPSPTASASLSHTVTGLAEATTYYWRVVSRTMANLERSGPVWSFRTQGAPPPVGGSDVVLHAWRAPSVAGWSVVADTSAAGGKRLSTPNAGAPKLAAPLASPEQYFEMGFVAEAGVPYRLWIRGKAASNSYENDSVYVQFSDSVTSSGAPQWRIGTTSATTVSIEDCSRCLANWGWADNAVGTLGPLVYFAQPGAHRLRVQVREDGLSIDQIILSPAQFLTTAPGSYQNDGSIYAEQNGAPLDGNLPPTVSLTSPANGSAFTAPGPIALAADAADSDGSITAVEFYANDVLLGSDATAPYSFTWTSATAGSKWLTARAIDNRGEGTTSAAVSITVNPAPTAPGEEIVLYASGASVASGWAVTTDTSAAGGSRLQNANLRAAKLSTPLASPTLYFEMTFNALAGRPYHLWIRGKPTSDSYENDSVYVQFDGSVEANGVTPIFRIGSTSAATITIEDCAGCGLAGWGWQDTASTGTTTPGVLGPPIYFATSGMQRIRVQVREDGLGIDQIVLSSVHYTTAPPGTTKNDATILPAAP